MNLGKVIKEQRNKMSLSQEGLGEKIFVTRQTISSWENDKSYPDINSLILLSQAFEMSIDNLVKGDLEIMEQKIEQNDIRDLKRNTTLMSICIIVSLVTLPISWYMGFIPGILIALLTAMVAIFFGYKADMIKKQYDVQTYREIVAFSKGETLDEITKTRESGKRNYQKFLYITGAIILGFLISQIVWWILYAL